MTPLLLLADSEYAGWLAGGAMTTLLAGLAVVMGAMRKSQSEFLKQMTDRDNAYQRANDSICERYENALADSAAVHTAIADKADRTAREVESRSQANMQLVMTLHGKTVETIASMQSAIIELKDEVHDVRQTVAAFAPKPPTIIQPEKP